MAVNLSPVGGVAAQFFTNTGAVLTGGKIYTYAAGTTTPATTFTSSNGLTAWTNPIVLDAAGRVPTGGEIWLTDGITYKFVLRDANDVLIATYDNISGINSNSVSFTNQQQIIVATANQTVFNLSISYQVATNSLSVFVDGVNQYGPGAQYAYTETSSTSVTFTNGLHVGAVVKFTTTQQQGAGSVNASQVTYNPAGTGAVATNVQVKLRETISVTDYGADPTGVANSSTAFTNAATAAGNQSAFVPKGTYALTGTISGNFYSLGGVTISSGTVTINDLTNYQFAGGARDAVCYAGAQSVKVFRNYATMGGFRFRGQYTKGSAPTFPMPSNKTVTLPGSLGGMTATTFENWYGIFACANDGDATATLKVMPFLRANSVASSTITLSQFKEGMVSLVPQTYAWTSANNLAGCDLLVITENTSFSGRVTSITANTSGTISVSTIGSIVATDTFLPSPPGYDHYVYLGTFYEDTAEVRNIYDSGTLAKSKGIYTLYPNTATGAFQYPTFTAVDCTGYISPLATAVVLDSSCILSTPLAGAYAEYFAGDSSNHIVQTAYVQKDNSTNMSVVFDNIQVPFLYPQQFSYANDGTLNVTRTNGQFNITGWFEP
jgi:hypothetical protein